MMVGRAGSGKTTLINVMINYVLGVEWEDNYRFKLIEEMTSKSQVHSQTLKVIVYQINHVAGFKIPYSLTIVDSPGFGDTRGIEEDKKIIEKIHECFTSSWGIDQINAICFVVQSPLARLTPTQKYVFDSILTIFGKDIKQNMQIFVTFADTQKPQVLEALLAADVPCAKDERGVPVHFKFNNATLYLNNTNGDGEDIALFNSMFWKMGMKSTQSFFTTLTELKTRTLTLTKEVLKERRVLEVTLQGIIPKIEEQLLKLHELEKLQEAEESEEVAEEAKSLITRASESHRRLEEIALKPNPMSTPDYIDLLIHTEKRELKPGYQERIDALEKAKSQACVLHECQGERINLAKDPRIKK
ncbi:uncharacterized protein O3C94_006293 [Discoglossus pictus]